VAASRSKTAGSYPSGVHETSSSCSGSVGSAIASSRSAKPSTPPQSSGGQARSPPVQIGYAVSGPGSSIDWTTTSCSHPSPKS
jgi:hypothetical protein